MVRLLVIAALASLACKMVLGKWPWDYLRAPDLRGQAILKARRLLGVEANARREEIIEAHRRLIAMVHPDRGGTKEQVHEANDARDLLLNALPDRGPELPE